MEPDHPLVRYFDASHLSGEPREVASKFWFMARSLNMALPDGSEKTVALRKLLESKDAAVRSALDLIE